MHWLSVVSLEILSVIVAVNAIWKVASYSGFAETLILRARLLMRQKRAAAEFF